ncbi:MAG: hypothetical protein FWH27_07565 [Planctomycetaceae bacterium]|nr:hypothetical protein [Planctomycetaceae bacterium]
MASPFKLFRKYQKSAFVLLGVMAMVSFIVLPAILQSLGRGGAANVTFATSRYGKIDQVRLPNILKEVSKLAEFYERLAGEIMIAHQNPCYQLRQLSAVMRGMSEEQAVEQWLVAQSMRDEGYTINRKEVGDFLSRLTYNQTTQQSYVNEEIYRKAKDAVELTDSEITWLVGNQLLINQFFNMSTLSVKSLTPETEFDWYNRFNRMMKIEAIPVSVSDFTSQAAAPSQKELKKIFEDNKFRDRNPWALESGFGVPMMARGEYVYYDKTMLQPEEVTDEEVEKFYEENKELYVERPMSTMPTPGLGGIPNPGGVGRFGSALGESTSDEIIIPTDDTTTTPDLPSDVTTPDMTPDDESPEPVSAVDAAIPETAESETVVPEDAASEDGVPEMPVEMTIQPSDETEESDAENESDDNAATETEAETPADEPEGVTEEVTGWNPGNVPIRLVSWQADAEGQGVVAAVTPEEAVENPVSAMPAEPVNPESAVPEAAQEIETPSVATTEMPIITLPPTGAPVLPRGGLGASPLGGGLGSGGLGLRGGLGSGLGGGLGSGLSGTTTPFGSTPIPNLGGSTNPALASTPVTYRPLDDNLKAEIRDTIARQKMDAKLAQVQEVMSEYHREYIKSIQQKNAKLTLPDLSALAGQHGLKYVNLGQFDSYDLHDKYYDFAQSLIESNNETVPVAQAVFRERGIVNEKRGYRSMNRQEGINFLFWITEIKEPTIPSYTDAGVAEQVEARWRQIEARSLAQAKADELAGIAQKAEGSLLEYFTAHPNNEVKTVVGTEFFSWMDYSYPNDYYRYLGYPPEFFVSEIRESGVMPGEAERNNEFLKRIGDDFMQTVYHLEPGEIAVTHNESKDTFFVVRLVEVTPTNDNAFDVFVMDMPDRKKIYNMAAVHDRQSKVQQGAMKKVFEKTKFQWKVKPSEYQQQERLKSRQNPSAPDRRSPQDNIPVSFPQF